MRSIICATVGATLLSLAASAASAHATLEQSKAEAGSSYKAVLRVPHGCEGEATHTVKLRIPEGYFGVKPMPKAGWTLTTVKGPYQKAYSNHGTEVKEGVVEVIWSGGNLPDDQYDEFVVRGTLDASLAGQSVAFPVTQVCATKTAAWTDIAAPGQNAHALKMPAPLLTVTAKGAAATAAAAPAAQHDHSAHQHGAHDMGKPTSDTKITVGSLTITGAWTRQPPPGAKVAGGFLTITNTGTVDDRLVSFTTPVARQPELHEMAVVNGVMRMRPLETGLAIPAGATVELKPGSYHLMLVDLTTTPQKGTQVPVRLVFEKAGPVDLMLDVAATGAKGMDEHKH
jgi:hypothetical protein